MSFSPLLLYPRHKVHGSHYTGGWVRPTAGTERVQWRKLLALAGNRNRLLGCPARSLFAIQTELCQVQHRKKDAYNFVDHA
jgi:hypothetical protein